MKTAFPIVIGVCLALAQASANAQIDPDKKVKLEIKSQVLRDALVDWAQQTGIQYVAPQSQVANEVTTSDVKGTLTPKQALEKLLAGTPLTYQWVNERTVAIQDQHTGQPARNDSPIRLAESTRPSLQGTRDISSASTDDSIADKERLEEVVATGSLIRGSGPVGSPILVLNQDEIKRSGYGTAQQLIQSLPQNVRGSATEDSLITSNAVNFSRAAGVNLRGLGESSTLVLVNGRRVAAAGGFTGSFVDVSNLPLTAVERVEILTDGASATYGSDAIAGVVNFILRDNYDGLQTQVRGGGVTDGGSHEFQATQTFGKTWGDGNILLSYEYYDRTRLSSSDRQFAANSDLRSLGGTQFGSTAGNPGNITSPRAAGIPYGQNGVGLRPQDLLPRTTLFNTREGVDLLPDQSRQSLFITAKQHLTERIEAFVDLNASRRDYENRTGGQSMSAIRVPSTNPFFVTPVPGAASVLVNYNFIDDFGSQAQVGTSQNVGGALGARMDIGNGWRMDVTAAYDDERVDRYVHQVNSPNLREALGFDNPSTSFNPAIDGYFNIFADGSNTNKNVLDYVGNGFGKTRVDSEVRSAQAKVDGALFRLPAGDAMLAIGGEYREESLKRRTSTLQGTQEVFTSSLQVDLSRDVSAAFAEVRIPLVGSDNKIAAVQRLEVSAAYRYEDYSAFGSTTNPKFGLLWSPISAVAIRGSYGTSFRAPNFNDSVPQGQFFSVSSIPSIGGGSVTALILQGSNPDLEPETSTFWTAGVGFAPTSIPEVHVDLTYFDIRFKQRISQVGNPFGALLQPQLFAPVITLNPGSVVVQQYLDSPYFLPIGPTPPASAIAAIVDGRSRNLAITDVNGIDLTSSYTFQSAIGAFSLRLNGNYLFKFRQAVTATSPTFDVVDTIGNPVALKLRASTSWTRGPWDVTMFANYQGSYTDNVSPQRRKISSWSTFDLSVAYQAGELGFQWMKGVRIAATANNVFDRDPPFANNTAGVGYDPVNASPLGRFVALQISKEW